MAQTTVQNSNTIKFGSGKFEVWNGASYVNLGAMNGIVFNETWDQIVIKGDNVGEIKKKTSNHKCSVAGDIIEIDLANLNLIRGGIDIYAPVAGAIVNGASQLIVSGDWEYNDFIPFAHQNGDKTIIVITSVTGATDGALTAETDYFLVKRDDGIYGIIIKDSVAVTVEAQNVTIVYAYTPNASKTLSSGGKTVITPYKLKVTNTNEAGQDFMIEVYKGSGNSGIVLTLQPDDSDAPNIIPIVIEGVLDATKSAGDQLFKITDEQI